MIDQKQPLPTLDMSDRENSVVKFLSDRAITLDLYGAKDEAKLMKEAAGLVLDLIVARQSSKAKMHDQTYGHEPHSEKKAQEVLEKPFRILPYPSPHDWDYSNGYDGLPETPVKSETIREAESLAALLKRQKVENKPRIGEFAHINPGGDIFSKKPQTSSTEGQAGSVSDQFKSSSQKFEGGAAKYSGHDQTTGSDSVGIDDLFVDSKSLLMSLFSSGSNLASQVADLVIFARPDVKPEKEAKPDVVDKIIEHLLEKPHLTALAEILNSVSNTRRH